MKSGIVTCLAFIFLSCAVVAQAQVLDGHMLYNTMNSTTTRLITNEGQTINTWYCTARVAYMPYLMPDSTIWRPGQASGASMRGAAYGGRIEQYNWNGTVIKEFLWSNQNHQQHHDIQPMPNGNVLVVSWERKTREEAQAMGRVNISGEMWPLEIIDYDPLGDSVVWEWHVWDHLIQDVDPGKPNYGVIAEHPELLDINLGRLGEDDPPPTGDWIHANAIDYNEARDEIVFCSHHMHELYVIDHSTTTEEARGHSGGNSGMGGDILYRWGNPQNYDRGNSGDRRFYVVHGVNWIDPEFPGEGNIFIFNNGDRPGSGNDYSSVEEIIPPVDSNGHYYIAPDSAYGPEEPVWIYSDPGTFYSNHLSGAFRLPNGNTIACEGTSGHVIEVTPAGQIVWQYNCGGQTGRVQKYALDFLGIEAHGACVPDRCGLERISPNPFSRSTRISYYLSTTSEVLLTVHDAAGRVVATLANGVKGPGIHKAELHARGSTDARTLPAGVYFARLVVRTPAHTETEKLVLTQ